MVHKPSWFTDDKIFISYAPTCGINKDGEELRLVDAKTGRRTEQIDDRMAADVNRLVTGVTFGDEDTARWIDADDAFTAVPIYYDERPTRAFAELMAQPGFSTWTRHSLGSLMRRGMVLARAGHGSPSADLRSGEVPYIKVSDIRAGLININPSNRVSKVVAESFWRANDSGLREWDLITPIRTSKNIGEFGVLMPGQERLVVTKEVLILRAAQDAPFDNFYLLWALTLKGVRQQWSRLVFMQTNREDVGMRYRELVIPVPPDRETADRVSSAFRQYYLGSADLRANFLDYLSEDDRHHVFLSSVEAAEEAAQAEEEAGSLKTAEGDM